MSIKFFIYDDGTTVSPSSVRDLKILCQQVAPKSDVITSNYHENLTGADYGNNCILVVPGGSALRMGHAILASRWKVNELVNTHRFGYFGVCAGSYIASNSSYIFSLKSNQPLCVLTTDAANVSLTLGSFATGYGPFYPSFTSELKVSSKVAHIVTTDNPSLLYQAYIDGCAFANISYDMDIIARYADMASYTFKFEGGQPSHILARPPCCIRRTISDGSSGILLAGTHIETTIPDSHVLKAIEPESPASIYGEKFSLFTENRERMLAATTTLIQETFSLKK